MRGRKRIALLLAVILAVTACACGRKTTVEAYDTTPPIDLDETYALYAPDTVVLTIEGEPVTWQELYYEIVYYARLIEGSEGRALQSWDQICTILTDENGENHAYGEVALRNALVLLTQYHTMHSRLTAAGAVLSQRGQAAADAVREQVIEQSFGGDEQAFRDYLAGMYCTEELWSWFNEVDALYQYDGFALFYGENGSALPDEDVYAYAAGDPDGDWTEYVRILQLVLYGGEEEKADTEAAIEAALAGAGENASADPSGDPSGASQEDPETVFGTLYAAYNEEPALDHFPGGRAVYRGDTEDAIYEAALALEEYAWTRVPIEGADVYVMRVPVEPDAGVYFDESTGQLLTLRYYAAWQSYYEMLSGADGWLAGARAEWAEGFEDFSLVSPD